MKFLRWAIGNLAPLLMASLIVAALFVAIGFTLFIVHYMNFDWLHK
jgi:hypothetical protein